MDEVPACSLTIREVAERSGCPSSALRYYEAEGLISSLPRGKTQTRNYSPAVLDALEIIISLRGAGFGISEIREVMAVKRPEDATETRLARALSVIEQLAELVQQRRAVLEKADHLLQSWRQEIKEYQR